jgi:hypothetical protein
MADTELAPTNVKREKLCRLRSWRRLPVSGLPARGAGSHDLQFEQVPGRAKPLCTDQKLIFPLKNHSRPRA